MIGYVRASTPTAFTLSSDPLFMITLNSPYSTTFTSCSIFNYGQITGPFQWNGVGSGNVSSGAVNIALTSSTPFALSTSPLYYAFVCH